LFCVLWKIKNASQTGFEKRGEVATELRDYQIILHGLAQQHKQNCQISHISLKFFSSCYWLNLDHFLEFWWKFANLVSASIFGSFNSSVLFHPCTLIALSFNFFYGNGNATQNLDDDDDDDDEAR